MGVHIIHIILYENVHISFFIKNLFDKAFFFFGMRHVKTHFFVVVEKYESSLATENKELYLTI